MTVETSEASALAPDQGVVYADSDYAGLARRFVIVIVDFAVLFLALFLVVACDAILAPKGIPFDPNGDPSNAAILVWIGFCYIYLAIMKPSPVRTLGYLITGVRIINRKDRPPSIIRMSFRLLLWVRGPFHPIIDFFWLSSDSRKQTLRDKFAETYVVKLRASPIGYGKRKAAYYTLMGPMLVFWEIQPIRTFTQPEDSQ